MALFRADDLLADADRGDRLDIYRALGVSLSYERNTATGRELVHARSQLRGGGGRRRPRAPGQGTFIADSPGNSGGCVANRIDPISFSQGIWQLPPGQFQAGFR